MTFGTLLRRFRDKLRLTQREVSDLIDVSQSTYNSWESDINLPNLKYFFSIVIVLKCPIEEILEVLPQPFPLKDN